VQYCSPERLILPDISACMIRLRLNSSRRIDCWGEAERFQSFCDDRSVSSVRSSVSRRSSL